MTIRSVMGSLAAAALLLAGPALAVEAQRVDEKLNFDAEKMKVRDSASPSMRASWGMERPSTATTWG